MTDEYIKMARRAAVAMPLACDDADVAGTVAGIVTALADEVERLREVDGDNLEAYANLEAERDAVRDRLRRVILASRGCVEQVILRGSLPADVELRARNTLREIEAASVSVLSDTSRSGGTRDAVEKLVAERDGLAAYRTAAPELARRLAALLDALEECDLPGTVAVAIIEDIRDAYARNLERSKP